MVNKVRIYVKGDDTDEDNYFSFESDSKQSADDRLPSFSNFIYMQNNSRVEINLFRFQLPMQIYNLLMNDFSNDGTIA